MSRFRPRPRYRDHDAAYSVDNKDRMTEVFKSLRKSGIVALANFSCCLGCGCAELANRFEKYRAKGIEKVGSVFYHRQDASVLREYGTVMLAFSGAPDAAGEVSDEDTVKVGEMIVEALRSAGLNVEWGGSPHTRIEVDLRLRPIRPGQTVRLIENGQTAVVLDVEPKGFVRLATPVKINRNGTERTRSSVPAACLEVVD